MMTHTRKKFAPFQFFVVIFKKRSTHDYGFFDFFFQCKPFYNTYNKHSLGCKYMKYNKFVDLYVTLYVYIREGERHI